MMSYDYPDYEQLELIPNDEVVAIEENHELNWQSQFDQENMVEALSAKVVKLSDEERDLFDWGMSLFETCVHLMSVIHGHHCDLEEFDEELDEYIRPFKVNLEKCPHTLCVKGRNGLGVIMFGDK